MLDKAQIVVQKLQYQNCTNRQNPKIHKHCKFTKPVF